MAVQATKKQLSEKEAAEQIKAIERDFLNKIERIEKVRDEKIAAIIKKAEERQIREVKESLQ